MEGWHAADNGPIVSDWSRRQPISTAWHWIVANGKMFTAARGRRALSPSHTGKEMWPRYGGGCAVRAIPRTTQCMHAQINDLLVYFNF